MASWVNETRHPAQQKTATYGSECHVREAIVLVFEHSDPGALRVSVPRDSAAGIAE